MKHIFICAITCLLSFSIYSQESTYITYEFMRVDETQNEKYLETETFWSGIHKERLKAGEILSWGLWSLQPGGEDQGYQYLTVTSFKNMRDMMKGTSNEVIIKHAKKAFPKKSAKEVESMFDRTAASRDLAVRMYLSKIDETVDGPEINVGAVAQIDLMKALSSNYETMESMVFKPRHQVMVNNDAKTKWSMFRVLFPAGDDRPSSHITINYFNNMDHFVDSIDFDFGDNSVANDVATEEGLKTRIMSKVLLGTLIKQVK